MLMYKSSFGWLALNGSTREESCKTVHFIGIFMGESQTAIYLNYFRMLCTYSVEHIAIFQVGISLRIPERVDSSVC